MIKLYHCNCMVLTHLESRRHTVLLKCHSKNVSDVLNISRGGGEESLADKRLFFRRDWDR